MVCCNVVIYSNKYIFGLQPTSRHRAPKNPWSFLWLKWKTCLWYVNETTLGKPLATTMGAGCLGSQSCDERFGTFDTCPIQTCRRGGGWRLNPSAVVSDLINHAFVRSERKKKNKKKKPGFRDYPCWWAQGDLGKSGAPREYRSSEPSPIPCPTHFFLAVSGLYPFYNELLIYWGKCFFEFGELL